MVPPHGMVLTWMLKSQPLHGNSSFWSAPELPLEEFEDFLKDIPSQQAKQGVKPSQQAKQN